MKSTSAMQKIETILVRSVGNIRGRDFYDAYLLLSANRNVLNRQELIHAIKVKAEERGSVPAIENQAKTLGDIAASPDIA